MVEYDVLGNERHKAICKLREMPKLYPNKDGGADLYAWKRELANAIGADTELFSAIRDRLIHLLGGDQPKFSELFGILGEDDDGVDAEGRYGDCSDSPDHGSAGCACGGACGCADSGGVAPITTELRDHMRRYHEYNDLAMRHVQHVELHADEFDRLCDNIDAIHAGLERENEELRKRTMYPSETERVNMLEREVKRLTSECKTQRNNFDQATSAREHWKTLYEQALEQIHDLERDYATACYVNERQDLEYIDLAKRYDKTITLPLDADGVPIRVGDVVRLTESWRDLTVLGVGIVDAHERSWGVFVREGHDYVWYNAEFLHHHKPTVEDVLAKFALACEDADKAGLEVARIIADYAAKLKLADA